MRWSIELDYFIVPKYLSSMGSVSESWRVAEMVSVTYMGFQKKIGFGDVGVVTRDESRKSSGVGNPN